MSDPTQAKRTAKPNLIVILADDMGFSDIGCFGAEIETPTLDALAAGGLRMSQHYNCARCCPTRAALMTGLYPHQAGVGEMVGDKGTPAYQGYLRDDAATLPEHLKAAGYRTLMSGKWHVGGPYKVNDPDSWRRTAGTPGYPTPLQRGFDDYYGTLAGAGSFWRPPTLMRGDQFIDVTPDEDYHYTDATGQEAARMIGETAQDQPFFLYAAFTAPHWPLHAREADIAHYRERYRVGWDDIRNQRYAKLHELGVLDAAWPMSPRDPDSKPWSEAEHIDWQVERMAVYAAMITQMDRAIGEIVAAVSDRGQMDDTAIMFLSDNGGCAEFLREDGGANAWPGHYAIPAPDGKPCLVGNHPGRMPGDAYSFQSYDLSWANASNTPFRLFKSWTHEGGCATPFVFSYPNAVRDPGRIHHGAWHVIDIAATCLDLAGATPLTEHAGHAVQPLSGESFADVLSEDDHRREGDILWEHINCRAIRRGDRKAVKRRDRDAWELYDMAADRTELDDLAEREPDVLAELTTSWDAWATDIGALPKPN